MKVETMSLTSWGRLFSVLEDIQYAANPEISATIKDRYFDAACATPALAFPALLKLAENHMSKIKRSKPGSYNALNARLRELLARIDGFPESLSQVDQGIFLIGYYHQVHYSVQQRVAKKQQAEASAALEVEEA